MEDLASKVNGNVISAPEWTQIPAEIQNVILDTGIVLSAGDLQQLGSALAAYSAVGNWFDETGSANAYQLGAVGLFKTPPGYADGMLVRFRPSNASSGASTLQIASLGTKTLLQEDGTPIIANDLVTTRDAWARYDSGLDDFLLIAFAAV